MVVPCQISNMNFHKWRWIMYRIIFPLTLFFDIGDTGRRDPSLPRITEDIGDLVAVRGSPAQWQCRAEGFPTPGISWLKDNVLLPESATGTLYSIASGMIVFFDVSATNVGVYQCKATNSQGSVKGRNATLQLAYLRNDFRPEPSPTTGILGNQVVLECIPPRGNPPPTVGWEKDGQEVEVDERVLIMEDHNLMIKSVRLEDAGSYVCTATNIARGANQPPVRSSPTNLTVKAMPTFSVVPEDIIAELGETVLFNCEVPGDPPPELMWRKENGDLPEGRHEVLSDGSLRIHNVQAEDAGNYLCVVNKDLAVYQEGAMLRIGDDPDFVVTPRDQTVFVDQDVALYCEAGGNPPPAVYWESDEKGLTLYPGNARARFRVDSRGTLHITGAQEEDAGTFDCSIRGESGKASAVVRVIGSSLSPPPVIKMGPSDQTLVVGSTAVFNCQLLEETGNVLWTNEGQPLPSRGEGLTYSFDASHTLRVLSVQASDSGQYECTVSNSSGDTTWSATLNVIPNHQTAVQPPPQAEELPRAPPSLAKVNVTRSSVRLTWVAPTTRDNQSPVTSYRLEYFTPNTPEGWVEVADIESTRYTVTGLLPGTPYVFLVRAVNARGVSFPSAVTQPVLTLNGDVTDDVGSAVLSSVSVDLTKAVPLSPTAILLQWEVSEASGSDVTLDGFKIKCRPSSGVGVPIMRTVMGVSSYIVTSLVPGEDYTVSVRPFHGQHAGAESSLEAVRTLPEGQLAPYPTTVDPVLQSKLNTCGISVTGAYPFSPSKLQLTWTVESHSAYINGYHVAYHPEGSSSEQKIVTVTESRSLVLRNLEPWTSYAITVRPFNGLHRGGESEPYVGTTAEDVPRVAPGSVQVNPNGTAALVITWRPPPPNRVNGVLTGYTVYCLSDGSNVSKNITVADPEATIARVGHLTPSAWYRVSVAALTSAGVGPASTPVTIQMTGAITPFPPVGSGDKNMTLLVTSIVLVVVLIIILGLVLICCMNRHSKAASITKASLHYEPSTDGIGLTVSPPNSYNHQNGTQQPLPPLPTEGGDCGGHGNPSLLTTFSTTNGTLRSTLGCSGYWPAPSPLNHHDQGPAYWLLEQQDPNYGCHQGLHNQATLSSASSTMSGHRARSPVYAVVDEEDYNKDPHCSHSLPSQQCTVMSNPATSTLPPQPYASTQLCPPHNIHFGTAPKCTSGSSSNDTTCSATSCTQSCLNTKPNGRPKNKAHRKKRSKSHQPVQQRPSNTWSEMLPPPPHEPPHMGGQVPHMHGALPYNYHTGSSSGSKGSQPSHPQPVTCHGCMQMAAHENMTLPVMHHHYPPTSQYPAMHHHPPNQRTYPPHAPTSVGGPMVDPASGRVFQPITRPAHPGGEYPQNGGVPHHLHPHPQQEAHYPVGGGHHLAPQQVFDDPRHAEIGQELLQYNELMSQSEAPSDNEEGHPMLPRITKGTSEPGNLLMPPVSEHSDLDAGRGDEDCDASSYCTGSIVPGSVGGSAGEDEASEESEGEGDRFLHPYPTNSLPMVPIGNGIQVGSQV